MGTDQRRPIGTIDVLLVVMELMLPYMEESSGALSHFDADGALSITGLRIILTKEIYCFMLAVWLTDVDNG